MTTNKQSISLAHYAEYFLLRILRAILLCLPVDVASYVIGKIWRIVGPFNNRHGRVLRHIEWAIGDETTMAERHQIARAMWENIGRTFCEGLIVENILKDKSRIIVNNEAFRYWNEECVNGALLLTHHFGNWELISVPTISCKNHNIMGVYRRVKNPLVEAFFLKIRNPLYTGGLFSQQGGAARQAVTGIRAGKDMAMVTDLRDNRGIKVNFFDMPTSVSNFTESLAIKYDKPVFVAQLRRLKGAHFILDMMEIKIEPTGNFEVDCFNLTQAVHRQFELWIRKNPEQWMWAPYRWSGRWDTIEKPISWDDFCQLDLATKTNNLDN